MSSHLKRGLPTLREAMRLLRRKGCNSKIVEHSILVSEKAEKLAEKCLRRGLNVDLELVRIGGLLHDLGRSVTADVRHGVVGAEILRKAGFDEGLARIVERHVGAGIPRCEAEALGLPSRDYMPETLEEKIVCYADKLAAGDKIISIDQVLKEYSNRLGSEHPAISRIKKLHEEIMGIIE